MHCTAAVFAHLLNAGWLSDNGAMHRSLTVIGAGFFELKGGNYICHRLLHLVPVDGFDQFTLRFGSKFIMEELHKCAAGELDKFLRLALSKDRRTLTAELARQGFEFFAHRLLAKGGQFKVRQLGVESAAPAVVRFPVRNDAHFRRKDEVNVDNLAPDVYACMPDGYHAVDGMAWASPGGKTDLDLFQMTVSERHGMVASNLASVLKTMRADALHARLFWVVPSDMFEDFPVQTWKKADGSVLLSRPPAGLDELQQFVLAIDVP